jgi:hypothetical protein
VVGADRSADESYDEAFLLAGCGRRVWRRRRRRRRNGYCWWQLEAGKPEKRKAPQWEVLAANRAGWEAGLKKVEVDGRADGSE